MNSDQLKHRVPYRDESFTSKVDPFQVSNAFGSRSIPKYAALLAYEHLDASDRVRALTDLTALISSQEDKKVAIQNNCIKLCTALLQHEDDAVKTKSANVIASLLVDFEARAQLSECKTIPHLGHLLYTRTVFLNFTLMSNFS